MPEAAMKYLFCTDVTQSPEVALPEGTQFLTGKLSQSTKEHLSSLKEALERAQRLHRFPTALNVVRIICLYGALIFATGIIRALGDVSLAQAYRNASTLFWVAGILLLVGRALTLCRFLRERRARRSESIRTAQKRLNEAVRSAAFAVGVPAASDSAEILCFPYDRTGNGFHVRDAAVSATVKCFRANGCFCIYDGESVYSLPLAELTGITVINHGIPLLEWNQRGSPEQKRYRRSGVISQGRLGVGLQFCCALELVHDGERFALLFPAYELPTVQKLTGLNKPKFPAVTLTEKRKEKKTRRASASVKIPPADGRLHPTFYWRLPDAESILFWFSPASDVEFRSAHPKLYGLLLTVGLFALISPVLLFAVIVLRFRPDAGYWLLPGCLGGFVMGIGFFNIIAAWLHQYLGHFVTLSCIAAGAALMALSLLLL